MIRQHAPVSLGALAVIICLALPLGMLSMLADTTTAEQIDMADTIFVGRVASLQVSTNPDRTIVDFDVDHTVVGKGIHTGRVRFAQRMSFRVGDELLVLMKRTPDELLGQYLLAKNEHTLQTEVLSPVTGLAAYGLSEYSQVPLGLLEQAILARRGLGGAPGPGEPRVQEGTAVDPVEPNDTLGTATAIVLPAPMLITGMPLCVTGMTIAPLGDLDFFSFDATPLTVLHASTQAPASITGPSMLDTVLGLFDGVSGDLLAFDDDGGDDSFSRLAQPLEDGGPFAVAVASAPDTDFTGDGTTQGPYELKLELELGSYLWNAVDQMLGLSPDGTFIEDGVGYRCIDGQDVLLPGVAADGWGLMYDAADPPNPVTAVFGGAGDQLGDPGFTEPTVLEQFQVGGYEDLSGHNRRGFGQSQVLVPYSMEGANAGVGIVHTYRWSLGSDTLDGDVTIVIPLHLAEITGVVFKRVLDIDLFGEGSDQFAWEFEENSRVKAFAVDTATHVGNLMVPATTQGTATDDMQAALYIDHGRGGDTIVDGRRYETIYDMGFTFVKEEMSRDDAIIAARDNLRRRGLTTWVIAADQDPDSGGWAAFGIGLADR